MDKEFCFNISKGSICLSYFDIGKLAGLGIVLFTLMSAGTDFKFLAIIIVLFLIAEILLGSLQFTKNFDIPEVTSGDNPVRTRNPDDLHLVSGNQGSGTGGFEQDIGYSGGPLDIPERYVLPQSGGNPVPQASSKGPHKRGKMNTIYSGDANWAYKQNVDWNSIKHKVKDPENDYYRDQYSRNRLYTAVHESNLTEDGHRYGAPQETRTLRNLPQITYLDSMGIYPGGMNNGSFERSWVMN